MRSNGAAYIGQFNDLTPGNGALINDGLWHHVAVVCNGTTSNNIQIYVDGALKSTGLGALNITGQNLRLGKVSSPSTGEEYDGQMDEVRIWDKALTANEIACHMFSELSGSESGLIAYYNFEEGTPNVSNAGVSQVLDQGGSNHGTPTNFAKSGTASNWVDGRTFPDGSPTAIDFDGTDDYVSVNKVVLNSGLTYQAWVKTSSAASVAGYGGNSALTIVGDRTNNIWNSFGISNGHIVYRHYTGSWVAFGSPQAINDGNWHHVTITHSATNNAKLYVDGVEVNSGSITYAGGGGAGKVGFDAVGASYHSINPAGDFFDGQLDEVRVWNKVLTANEIGTQMNTELLGTESGLVAYYNFQEGIPDGNNAGLNVVLDKTGNNHGIPNGFTKSGSASNWVNGQTFEPEIAISGNGQNIPCNATPMLSNHTDYGKLATGGNLTRTFTITNNGDLDLILDANPVTLSGSGDFSLVVQPTPLTLAPGGSTTFDVTFTPTSSGIKTATASIASNDPNSPFTFDIQGSTNTALDFDGSDDRMLIPWKGEMATQEFTYEFWVKPAIQDQMRFVTKWSGVGGGTTGDFLIDSHYPGQTVNGEHLRFVASNGNAHQAHVANVLTINAWNHVAVSFDNGNVKMYVNGSNVLNTNLSISSISHNNFDLEFGTDRNGIGRYNGQVDELRIWSRALCQAEIQGRMNSSLQGNENGLVAYYDFEEGVPGVDNTALPNTVFDKAGTNHGTMNSFAKNNATSNWVDGSALTDDGFISGSAMTWLGTSTDWNTATNWSPNGIPSQCNNVVIPTTANDPTFSNNQAVNSIEIQSGATLIVGAGGCLWVGSTFENNGEFILEATSTNYAQYQGPQVEGTLSQVIGEAGWHTIASPFTDATLGDIEFDQNAILQFGTPQQTNIQYYDGGEHQPGPPAGWTSAWGSWVPASGLTDVFNGSRAYNLYLDDVDFADAFPVTMTVSGTLRNMPITQSLNGANGGWNNLSNPFPSVIDWEKWSDNSAIHNTYYVWDASTNNYNTYMTGGTSVPAATLTQYIAPYQSVFVRTSNGQNSNSGDETDVFQDHLSSNADRPTECPSVINEFYKTEPTGELHLEARANNGKFADELAIRFGNGFSEGFVADEEAAKFFSPAKEVPQVYTLIDNEPYVISSYPMPEVVVQHIPLGLKSIQDERLTIAALKIPKGITAILEDKEKDEYHNLKSAYSFTATSVLDNARFVLHVGDEHLTKEQLGASDDYIAYIKDGNLNFVYNEKLFGGNMRLISISGQVLAKTIVKENGSLSVAYLPQGVYIITVSINGKFFKQKIVL